MIDLLVSRGASPCVPSSSGRLVSSKYLGVQHNLNVIRKEHALKLVSTALAVFIGASDTL